MELARSGKRGAADTAARCELALLGIREPTIEQRAGATLRALQAEDLQALRRAWE